MTRPAGDPRLRRLDAPAKAALRWAWAMVLARPESGDRQVDSRDLLAGILLADPRGSPARDLLEHYRIPVGAVLHRDRVRPPTPEELLEALEEVPEDQVPEAIDTARGVIEGALSAPVSPPDTLVSVRELFGELLDTSGPEDPINRELLRRGADLKQLAASYGEYLDGRQTYGEFLRERFPYRPPRVELPGYLADQPQTRGPSLDGLPDLVGINAEVDAFAYLMASKNLIPPLAVGLFGDWGSGKSYFLRSLQRRIDLVARDSATQEPGPARLFHPHIMQIEFNAWQYVDGDLWASLLEHLFRNLRRTGDDSDNLLAQRQHFWVRKVQGASTERVEAELKRKELEDRRDAARQEVDEARRQREQALAELERQRQERPLAGWRPSAELRKLVGKAAAEAGVVAVGESADELARELGRARDTLRGAGSVVAPLRARGWRYQLAVAGLVVLPVVVALVLSAVDWAPLAAVTTTVASLLAAAAGYVKLGTRVVSVATQRIQQAQAELDAAGAEQRARLDGTVAEAESRLAKAQAALDAAVHTERDLAAKADEATAELVATTPRRVLSDFIADRLASEDYRRHLGVPAIVRRDLERLSQLVAAQRDDPASDPVPDDYAIDRIVLYIDDLDRCPTELVIKVLEAVHLLLAFPLFVVVVAVDSRWLTQSLTEHYAQLGGNGATPENYLEKIFQVPFWLLPVETKVRQQILRGLLTPSVAAEAPPASAETRVSTSGLPAADVAEYRELVESFAVTDRQEQAWRAATALRITNAELCAIESVADLVGTTPRAAKRFANIYLLVRSIGVNRGLKLPPDGQLAALLAISGIPNMAGRLLIGRTLGSITRPDYVTRWFDAHPEHRDIQLSGLADWISLILRFRFSSVRPVS